MFIKNRRMLLALFFLAAFLISMTISCVAETIYTGKINYDKVFFRMQANTSCAYHAVLKKGEIVGVSGTKGDFYKVKFDGKDGFVMKKFVTLSASDQKKLNGASLAQSKSKYVKVATIKGLGSIPSSVRYGEAGENVEKLQRALQIKKCYKGVVDGKFGKLTQDALKTYQQKQSLTVNGKADYATIRSLFGSVSETTAKDDPKMNGITRISQIPVPNTTKPNNSGKHVVALQQALKLKGYFSAPIDGRYDNKTVEAVKKFQKHYKLSEDGIAGHSTIKKLFGKNPANYTIPTEQLDWFNGGSNVIPKGATFIVKDVQSGVCFTCRRWSGYNHLDAEPINAEATAAFKSAVGSWTWARRPVLVKYEGHVYAASINCMPHEDNTIQGNNFKGHFCIHFYKSRTHATNHLDKEHQNCVARAMHATW